MANFMNNRNFLCEFIDLYSQLPEVWKVKSYEYKNRHLKNLAYEKLIEKLKEVEPNVNREIVRKKINVLRSAYRRELKKVITSSKSGSGTESVYKPSLWYYHQLDFLRDQENQIPRTSNTNDLRQSENEDTDLSQKNCSQEMDTDFPQETDSSESPIQRKAKKRKRTTDYEESQKRIKLLKMTCKHLRSSNNEMEILAKSWALEFIKLSIDQQIHAKKTINDILYEERLGTLQRNSVSINESVFCPHSDTTSTFMKNSYPSTSEQIITRENKPQYSPGHSPTYADPVLILQGPSQINCSLEMDSDFSQETDSSESSIQRKAKKRKGPTDYEELQKRIKLLKMTYEHLRSSNNEVEIVAKSWALEFIKLSTDQQIHAKKAINNILYEGRLGTLQRNSVSINESAFRPHSNTTSTFMGNSYPSTSEPIITRENKPKPSLKFLPGYSEMCELLKMTCEHLHSSNIEVEIVANSWALQFIKLSTDQQIHAKNVINDILYEGRLGTLQRNLVSINESAFCPILTLS